MRRQRRVRSWQTSQEDERDESRGGVELAREERPRVPSALEGDTVHEHDRHEEREGKRSDRMEPTHGKQYEDGGEQRIAQDALRRKQARENGVDHSARCSRGDPRKEHGDRALHGHHVLRVSVEHRDGVHREPTASAEDREPEQCTEQGSAQPITHGANTARECGGARVRGVRDVQIPRLAALARNDELWAAPARKDEL